MEIVERHVQRGDLGRPHGGGANGQAADHSYFLFSLAQGQLAQAVFPCGMLHKDAVRGYARAAGLPVARPPLDDGRGSSWCGRPGVFTKFANFTTEA